MGLGSVALATLLSPAALAQKRWAGIVRPTHLVPRAKRVIYLCMAGGPSHLESFDYKPELARRDGELMPASFTKGQPIAQLQGQPLRILGPRFPFAKHGQSGQEVSSRFPHIATIADRICILRSMQTEQINHDPAHTFMNTGTSSRAAPASAPGSSTDSAATARTFLVSSSWCPREADKTSPSQSASGRAVFFPAGFRAYISAPRGSPSITCNRPPGDARATARCHRCGRLSQSPARSRSQRSRDRHADEPVRDGLPHADERPRAHRFLQRATKDPRALRHRRPPMDLSLRTV